MNNLDKLKNLRLLNLLELPLKRYKEFNNVLGITEHELEEYLIDMNYNIYDLRELNMKDVLDEDLTTDSTLIFYIMYELDFSKKILSDDTYLFYIEDNTKSRHIEIIQSLFGNSIDLDYETYISEEGELYTNIYVYNVKEDKEYKIIYSIKDDTYSIPKYRTKVSGYYWINGKDEEESKKNTLETLDCIKENVISAYGSFYDYKVTDTIRYDSLEEWDNEEGLCFENHFEGYIDGINFQEDTEEHYVLEGFFNVGLSLETE